MSFLKKLFPGSKSASKSQGLANSRNSRAPRVRIGPLHEASFSSPGLTSTLGLGNLSVSGVGLIRTGNEPVPEVGTVLQGRMKLGWREFDCSMRLVRSTPQILGCAFETPSIEFTKWIHDYFEIELTATTLTRAPASVLQADPNGAPNWLHGSNQCEVYFVARPDGSLASFNMSFFGNYIEGADGKKTRFGKVEGSEDSDKPSYKESSLIRWDASIAVDLKSVAKQFISHLESLSESERAALLRGIED